MKKFSDFVFSSSQELCSLSEENSILMEPLGWKRSQRLFEVWSQSDDKMNFGTNSRIHEYQSVSQRNATLGREIFVKLKPECMIWSQGSSLPWAQRCSLVQSCQKLFLSGQLTTWLLQISPVSLCILFFVSNLSREWIQSFQIAYILHRIANGWIAVIFVFRGHHEPHRLWWILL